MCRKPSVLLASLLIVLGVIGCQGEPPGELTQADFDVTVRNSCVNQPMLDTGSWTAFNKANSLTISWPADAPEVGFSVTWPPQRGAIHYEVERTDDPDGGFVRLATTAAPRYFDAAVEQGKTYLYRVVMVTAEGARGESRVAQARVIELKGDVLGYNVFRSRTAEGPYYQINPELVTGNSFTDRDLPADSAYYYKVSLVLRDALKGPVDPDLGDNEVAFFGNAWGKTKKKQHTSLRLALHPCPHSETSKTVSVVVRVFDDGGDVVKNLWKSNFKIDLDGKNRPLLGVWPIFPLGIQAGGLIMDYSGSMYATKRDIPLMERALISGLVGTKDFFDRFEVIKYDTKIISYTKGFTANLVTLLEAITGLNDKFGGATAFFDALHLALVNTAKETLPLSSGNVFNKKYVVGWTDGEENSSKIKRDELILTARKSCVPIYSVGYDGKPNSWGIKHLEQLANGTGGAVFLANNQSTGLFEKISTHVNAGYVLTMMKPKAGNAPAASHTVTVTATYNKLSASQSAPFTF